MKRVLYWLDAAVFLGLAVLLFTNRPWDARSVTGLAIALVGFCLWSLARLQLGASFSVRPQARQLVTHGLYARFRNPIYFFGVLAYAGLALAWGHWIGLLILAFMFAMQQRRARLENAVLKQAFGEDYRRYRARTWF